MLALAVSRCVIFSTVIIMQLPFSLSLSVLPKMEVCNDYYGMPPPPVAFGQPLQLTVGDVIELTRADADLQWWEVRLHCFIFAYYKFM